MSERAKRVSESAGEACCCGGAVVHLWSASGSRSCGDDGVVAVAVRMTEAENERRTLGADGYPPSESTTCTPSHENFSPVQRHDPTDAESPDSETMRYDFPGQVASAASVALGPVGPAGCEW